ncbi:MAG: tripartite tricarboxylate transporter TctB family protein [Sphaerochaeta sp.]|nr:tripartite tricarboxylate transporter TctB family protein [Sphaerochaeta sp.]
MHSFLRMLKSVDRKIDQVGESLEGKKANFSPSLVGPCIFLAFAVAAFLLMPSQVKVQENMATTARTFPTLLLQIMIAGSVLLLGTEIVKIIRKMQIEVVEVELLTEIKAVVILLLLVLYALLMPLVGFIVSSLLFSIAMLYYFRIKKVSYYLTQEWAVLSDLRLYRT